MFVIEALQNSKNDLNLTKAHRSKVQQHITSNHSKWPSLKKTKHTNKEKKQNTQTKKKNTIQQEIALLVQWLRHHDPYAGVPGLIPGHAIKFHTQWLRFVATK